MADLQGIFSQAVKRSPEAMRNAAALTAMGLNARKDWRKALEWLEAAAAAGSERAAEELELLGPNGDVALLPPPKILLNTAPYIARAEGVVSRALCDWIIARARPLLGALEVYDMPEEGRDENGQRSNTGAALRLMEFGLPLIALRERIARLVGVPVEGFETANVLHYDVGETFSPHYDTFLETQMQTEPDARRYGHREFTALIYLNTEYEGGHTDFPLVRWNHRGGKGDALIWRNVTPNRELDRLTLHAGLAPTSGEKWVLSQWIRGKRMPYAL